ncbi:MAG: DNA primase [Acidobacteriota bacterium]
MAFGNIDLTPQLVQAVRDAIDIVDIAADHTRLTPKGQRHEGLCPLHKEKTPSFSVDPDRGLYYCFGCGAGGDAIKLHMELSGDDFPAAIESLALRYGVPITARKNRRRKGDEADIEGALAAAEEFFRDRLMKSKAAYEYLRRRRIPEELIERFGLGYAPDGWQHMLDALRGKVGAKDLIAAGLAGRSKKSGDLYDRFRHRLMFPIHNTSGRLVGFGGRTLGDDKAKYINTRETDRFHKGTLLYGLFQARRAARETGRVVLTEGYFDVIAAAAAGFDASVASMGTSLTADQAHLIGRFAEEVVIGYDGDRAGEEAFRRSLPILLAEGLAVYRASFGEGHDPDSLRLADGEKAVARAIDHAPDGILAEIERLTPPGVTGEPQAQARAAREVVTLLRPIPDAVLRYGYLNRAAGRLDLPVEVLGKGQVEASREARFRSGPQPQEREGERPLAPPGPVRSTEERVLRQLLSGESEIPSAEALPPPEVFLDPQCRNIFRVFCTLYRENGEAPASDAVLAGLQGPARGQGTGEVDRFALVLLQTSFGSEGPGLEESLGLLTRRWRQGRLKELAREIQEAQKAADAERLDRLVREKTELSHLVHGGRP